MNTNHDNRGRFAPTAGSGSQGKARHANETGEQRAIRMGAAQLLHDKRAARSADPQHPKAASDAFDFLSKDAVRGAAMRNPGMMSKSSLRFVGFSKKEAKRLSKGG